MARQEADLVCDVPYPYRRLAALFDQTAVSDIAWARTSRWRSLLATCWPDIAGVSSLLQQLKLKYPQHDDASILVENEIPYDRVVQVMDAVRAGHQVQGAQVVTTDYFPNISVGDAPVIRQ